LVPTLAWADCSETDAAACLARASKCRAICARSDHQDEALHACHQECQANYVACRADAGCAKEPTQNPPVTPATPGP
jgi:hypothetical protein